MNIFRILSQYIFDYPIFPGSRRVVSHNNKKEKGTPKVDNEHLLK